MYCITNDKIDMSKNILIIYVTGMYKKCKFYTNTKDNFN